MNGERAGDQNKNGSTETMDKAGRILNSSNQYPTYKPSLCVQFHTIWQCMPALLGPDHSAVGECTRWFYWPLSC